VWHLGVLLGEQRRRAGQVEHAVILILADGQNEDVVGGDLCFGSHKHEAPADMWPRDQRHRAEAIQFDLPEVGCQVHEARLVEDQFGRLLGVGDEGGHAVAVAVAEADDHFRPPVFEDGGGVLAEAV